MHKSKYDLAPHRKMIMWMLCSQHDKDTLDQKGIKHYHYYIVRIAMVDHEKLSDLIAQSYGYIIQPACLTAIWGMQLVLCSLSKALPFQIFCNSTLLLRSGTLVIFLISQTFHILWCKGIFLCASWWVAHLVVQIIIVSCLSGMSLDLLIKQAVG